MDNLEEVIRKDKVKIHTMDNNNHLPIVGNRDMVNKANKVTGNKAMVNKVMVNRAMVNRVMVNRVMNSKAIKVEDISNSNMVHNRVTVDSKVMVANKVMVVSRVMVANRVIVVRAGVKMVEMDSEISPARHNSLITVMHHCL